LAARTLPWRAAPLAGDLALRLARVAEPVKRGFDPVRMAGSSIVDGVL
jgi:hypothetical protein